MGDEGAPALDFRKLPAKKHILARWKCLTLRSDACYRHACALFFEEHTRAVKGGIVKKQGRKQKYVSSAFLAGRQFYVGLTFDKAFQMTDGKRKLFLGEVLSYDPREDTYHCFFREDGAKEVLLAQSVIGLIKQQLQQ